jgi:hypothetical protein
MPTWLRNLHADLDRAVAAAYDRPEDISTDDALARLLDLDLERSATGPVPAAPAVTDEAEGDDINVEDDDLEAA